MRRWTIGVTLALVGTAVAAGVFAQQPRSVKPLTPQDYLEIQQLYARYTWAIDNHDTEAYGRMFTTDGEFFVRGVNHVGQKAIGELARAGANAPAPAPYHYTSNIVIEASPEGARGGAYYMGVSAPQPSKAAIINTTGTYRDVIVRTPEGWRFKSRKFFTNTMPDAPSN